MRGSDRIPKGDVMLGHENGSGVVYPPDGEIIETLEGEPPVAQTHGWGIVPGSPFRRWRR
jgi:hypothetical protein